MNTNYFFNVFNLTVLLFGLLWITGCDSELSTETGFTVKTRLAGEPDRLHPLLTNHTPALMINNYIFMPLADFDPQSLQLTPLLLVSIPSEEVVQDGPYKGDYKYTFHIREQAQWSDGKPVTASDYLFTVKAAFNPFANTATWRGALNEIKDIILDPIHPKIFSVIVENDYMLAKEITCTFPILPQHIYDPKSVLHNYTLAQLRKIDNKSDDHEELKNFTSEFSSATYSRDIVVGSGPYKLTQWNTKQSITLDRVDNWWGNVFKSVGTAFQNGPDKIVFIIITDEIVALTALKDGQIDIMSEVSPDQFVALQKNEDYSDKLSFKTPTIPRYYYLGLNTRSPALSDKKIRRALVHILDTEALIDDVAQGLGQPIAGPFSPAKSYYNSELNILEKDYEHANALIQKSGWTDSNENGTVDKVIDNQLTELELDILVTNKPLGQKIALLLQEGGKKVGIKVNIIKKDFSLIRKDLNSGNFDIAALVAGHSSTPNDPYQTWHTDNIGNGGRNYSGFGNAKSDDLIQKIRNTKDLARRDEYYKDLQELIYDEQPFIFLYAPVACIISNKQFQFEASSLRPGFFINTFKRAS